MREIERDIVTWPTYPTQSVPPRTLTVQGLEQIRSSIMLFWGASLLYLTFAAEALLLRGIGFQQVWGLDLFWLLLFGLAVMVPLNVVGTFLFLLGYEKMKRGKAEFGPDHLESFNKARKHLVAAATVALVGWVALPYALGTISFTHPPADTIRILTVGGWTTSMILTTVFVLEAGRGGEYLIKAFISSEERRKLKSIISLAAIGQIVGHAILLGYFILRPLEITSDIPPANSALFFPASAILVTIITLIALFFYRRSFQIAATSVIETTLWGRVPSPSRWVKG